MPTTTSSGGGDGRPWRIRRLPGGAIETNNCNDSNYQQHRNDVPCGQSPDDSCFFATMQQQQQAQQQVSSSITTATSSPTTSSTKSHSNNSSSVGGNNQSGIDATEVVVGISPPLLDNFVDSAFSGRRELQLELRRIEDDFRIHVEEQEQQLQSSLSSHDLESTDDDSMESHHGTSLDDLMVVDCDYDDSFENKDNSNQLGVSLPQQDDNQLDVSLPQQENGISTDGKEDSFELRLVVDDDFREDVEFHDAHDSMDSLINQEIDLTHHESQGTIEVLFEDQYDDVDSDSELMLYDAGGINDDDDDCDDESYFELYDEGGINDISEGSNSGYFELHDEGGINDDSSDDSEESTSRGYGEALQSRTNPLYDSQELQDGVHLDAVAEHLFPDLPKSTTTNAVATTSRKKNVGDNITTIIASISRTCLQPTKLQLASAKLQPPVPAKSKSIKFTPNIEIPSTRKYGNYFSDDVESSTEEDDYIDEESLTLFGKKNHSGTLLYDDSKNGSSAMLSSDDGSQQPKGANKNEERRKMLGCALYSILYVGVFGGIGYLAGNIMRILNKSTNEVVDGAGMVGEQAAADVAIQEAVSGVSTPETIVQQGTEQTAGAMMSNTPPTTPDGTTGQE